MIDLIAILGCVLLTLVAIHMLAKSQIKRLAQQSCNLQNEASEKVQRLKKIEEVAKNKLQTMNYVEQVANFISDGILVCDCEHILYVNPALAKLTGYSIEELIGKNWNNLVVKDDLERTKKAIGTQYTNGEIIEMDGMYHFINRWQCKDGRIITLWWSATGLDKDGICYAICRDVTRDNGRQEKIDKLVNELVDNRKNEAQHHLKDASIK